VAPACSILWGILTVVNAAAELMGLVQQQVLASAMQDGKAMHVTPVLPTSTALPANLAQAARRRPANARMGCLGKVPAFVRQATLVPIAPFHLIFLIHVLSEGRDVCLSTHRKVQTEACTWPARQSS